MPTTLTSEVGSAPTVSFAKSIFKVSAAPADAASATTDTMIARRPSLMFMGILLVLLDELRIDPRRAPRPPPGEADRQRQSAEEPGQRRISIAGERISRIFIRAGGRWNGHIRESIDQRQDLSRTGRAADVTAVAISIFDFAIAVVTGSRREGARAREPDGEVRNRSPELGQHV